MNYTNNTEQYVFLKDADIVNKLSVAETISGNIIETNGIPSYSLFKDTYNKLSSYDNNLSTHIKNNIELSIGNLSTLANEILISANNMSTLVESACISIDNLDSDISYISSVMELHELSGAVYFGNFVDYSKSELTVFLHDNIKQLVDIEIPGDYLFRTGYWYRFSTSVELNDQYFGINDYIIFNKDIQLKNVTLSDFDIIRDSNSEATKLCSDFTKFVADVELSASKLCSEISSNDADIKYLSAEILGLSSEVSAISVGLTADIKYLSDEISLNDINITYLSSELSDYHNTLSGIDRKNHDQDVGHIIETDNLMLTDVSKIIEGKKHPKYYMTMLSGTIVLKQI